MSFASRTSAKVKVCVSLAAITAVQAEEKAGKWRTENRAAPTEGIHKVSIAVATGLCTMQPFTAIRCYHPLLVALRLRLTKKQAIVNVVKL